MRRLTVVSVAYSLAPVGPDTVGGSEQILTAMDQALVQAGLAGAALHVSGCSKGCAHRLPCAVTLVGNNGRYDIVRDGTAAAAPWRTGLSLPDMMAALATLSEKIPA